MSTTTLIPKHYHQIAQTFDQYKKVTATAYYSKEVDKYLLKVEDHIEGTETLHGPFNMRQVETIDHVLTDVMWKAGIKK